MKIASAKFQIIHDLLQQEGNMVDIQTLCELANVSRSGYDDDRIQPARKACSICAESRGCGQNPGPEKGTIRRDL